MLKVKGIYDGRKVEISEKIVIPDGESQEVIVIFPDRDVYIEPFNLDKFIEDWSSAEIEAIVDGHKRSRIFKHAVRIGNKGKRGSRRRHR